MVTLQQWCWSRRIIWLWPWCRYYFLNHSNNVSLTVYPRWMGHLRVSDRFDLDSSFKIKEECRDIFSSSLLKISCSWFRLGVSVLIVIDFDTLHHRLSKCIPFVLVLLKMNFISYLSLYCPLLQFVSCVWSICWSVAQNKVHITNVASYMPLRSSGSEIVIYNFVSQASSLDCLLSFSYP